MCSCDYESADVYREMTRNARKDHRCAECRTTIKAGDTYLYASGIWDGRPDSFAFCTDCEALKKEWFALARKDGLCEPCWEFGSMHDAIFAWVEESADVLADRERQAAYARRNATVVMAVSP